jgi:hypothetical protein
MINLSTQISTQSINKPYLITESRPGAKIATLQAKLCMVPPDYSYLLIPSY